MSERPTDSRYQRPIVPDPEASLSGHRTVVSPTVRLWPLWSIIILLILVIGALCAAGWWYHQQLEQRLTRLTGELSNVHARFDAEQGRGDALDSLQDEIDRLTSRQSALDERLESVVSTDEEQQASLEGRLKQASASLATLSDEAEVRDETLKAVRNSLDALETAGTEGRAGLEERLATLQEAVEANETRRERSNEQLTSRLATTRDSLDSLQERVSDIGSDIEANSASREDIDSRVESMASRLESMQTELRDLRQAQLALSAQLESLR